MLDDVEEFVEERKCVENDVCVCNVGNVLFVVLLVWSVV